MHAVCRADIFGSHQIFNVDKRDPVLICAPRLHGVIQVRHVLPVRGVRALGDRKIPDVRFRHFVVHEREHALHAFDCRIRGVAVVVKVIGAYIHDDVLRIHIVKEHPIEHDLLPVICRR